MRVAGSDSWPVDAQDGDQNVDVYDILLLLGDFGLCDPRLISDGNDDGCVDVQDLMLLLELFGRDYSCIPYGCPPNLVGQTPTAHTDCVLAEPARSVFVVQHMYIMGGRSARGFWDAWGTYSSYTGEIYDAGVDIQTKQIGPDSWSEWQIGPPRGPGTGRGQRDWPFRIQFNMARIGHLICLVGGEWNQQYFNGRVDCFDTNTVEWIELPRMQVPRSSAGVAYSGDTMCATGGDSLAGPVSQVAGYRARPWLPWVECYTLGDDEWTQMPPLSQPQNGQAEPHPRRAHQSAFIGRVMYTVGGTCFRGAAGHGCFVSMGRSVVALDLDNIDEGWVNKAEMLVSRMEHGLASSGTKLYAVGGAGGGTKLDSLEIYDSTTDTWTLGSPMPTARGSLRAAIIGNMLFAVGGYPAVMPADVQQRYNTNEVYDILTDTWETRAPLLEGRYDFGMVAGP